MGDIQGLFCKQKIVVILIIMSFYRPVKFLLWGLLALTYTFSLIAQFSPVSLLLLAGSAIALSLWLARHTGELRKTYLSIKSAPLDQSSRGKLLWGNRRERRPADVAPGIVLLGLCSLYVAYAVSLGEEAPKLVKLAYELFGITGAIGICSFIGVILLAAGVEIILGSKAQ